MKISQDTVDRLLALICKEVAPISFGSATVVLRIKDDQIHTIQVERQNSLRPGELKKAAGEYCENKTY